MNAWKLKITNTGQQKIWWINFNQFSFTPLRSAVCADLLFHFHFYVTNVKQNIQHCIPHHACNSILTVLFTRLTISHTFVWTLYSSVVVSFSVLFSLLSACWGFSAKPIKKEHSTVLKTKPNRNLAMVPGMVLMLMSLTSLWDWAPVGTIGITQGNIQGNSMEPWLLGRENSRFNTKFEGLIRE